MSFVRDLIEQRSVRQPDVTDGGQGYGGNYGGHWDQGMVWRGSPSALPTTSQSMRLSAVFACLRLLSEAISTLPIDTFYRSGGVRKPFRPRPQYLSFDPPGTSRIDYLSQVMMSLLTNGNAFVLLVRAGLGEIVDLVVLDPTLVTVRRSNNKVTYRVGPDELVEWVDLIHIKGMMLPGEIVGLSPIAYARETIGLGLSVQRYGSTFFENGALPAAVVEAPNAVSQESVDRFMSTWNAGHQGVGNANKVGFLTNGAKLNKVSVQPNDSQFLECVVPGTLVTMADGTRRPVESLTVGDLVTSWDDDKLTVAPVAAVGTPPLKELVRVTTSRGRVLECTADHPVLTRRNMRTPGCRPITTAEWVGAGGLVVGNHVRVALGAATDSDAGSAMSFGHAYFLGAMVGDGYIRRSTCSFASAEPAITARVDEILRSMGGELRVSKSRSIDFAVKTNTVGRIGSPIRALLNASGLVGSHSHTKFVPEMVTAGGPNAWRGFLAGLIDTDGCVRDPNGKQNPCAFIASTSRELIDGAQHLLALLGIQSAVYGHRPAETKMVMGRMCDAKQSWTLNIMGTSQLRLLAIELDLAHPRKRDRLAWFLDAAPSRYRSDNFDFDRVISVEPLGVGVTVGVEIAGTHTHVTGGIVTHNTRAFQVPDIARIFGVPPHLIADASNSTSWGSGLAEQNLAFGQFSLRPWLERIEDTHSRLLTVDGAGPAFVKLNLDALLRASLKDRYEADAIGIQHQFLTINEARSLEDLPPVAWGDKPFVPEKITETVGGPAPAAPAAVVVPTRSETSTDDAVLEAIRRLKPPVVNVAPARLPRRQTVERDGSGRIVAISEDDEG